jgi:hypothetical protein
VRATCQRSLDSDLVPRWGGQDDRNPTFHEVLQEALRGCLILSRPKSPRCLRDCTTWCQPCLCRKTDIWLTYLLERLSSFFTVSCTDCVAWLIRWRFDPRVDGACRGPCGACWNLAGALAVVTGGIRAGTLRFVKICKGPPPDSYSVGL